MIGQIDIEKTLQLQPNKECLFVSVATVLNHVVDVVNELQKEAENNARIRANHEKLIDTLVQENNIHEKQIDELQMKLEPEKCETPAENVPDLDIQLSWIGKLCWFSQLYGCHQHIAILKRISESGLYVTDDGELHYAYCEPVKPDDDIIYKGGDNDDR